MDIFGNCQLIIHVRGTHMPRQRPPLPAGIAAQFFICGFIGFLGKLTISEHGGHGTQFGKAFGLHTIDMCAAIKLSFVASRGRESGWEGVEEALPVKCKGAISRMPSSTCVYVCVCVSLSFSLWIRIQIEVTNLNWPQKWLLLLRRCPAPAHFGAAWQKVTENKDSPLACVHSALLCPYPLTCAAFSVVLCTLFALHTLCNTGRRPIR